MRATRPRSSCSSRRDLSHAAGGAAYGTAADRAHGARASTRCSSGESGARCRSRISRTGRFSRDSSSTWTSACWCRDRPIAELIAEPLRALGRSRAACAAFSTSAPAPAPSRSRAPWPSRARAVDAVDISTAALAGVPPQRAPPGADRSGACAAIRSFRRASAGRRYDIIVSNPPYVGRAEMRALPREYRHEPRIGLASGCRRPGLGAEPSCPRRGGIWPTTAFWSWRSATPSDALMRAFPRLPFIWPDIAMGGGGVFVLRAARPRRMRN